MRVEITKETYGWFANVYVDGSLIWRSKAEMRAGCAARVGFNYIEQTYGRPSTNNFVIDLSEW